MLLSDYIDYDKALEELIRDSAVKKAALDDLHLRLVEIRTACEGVSSVDTSFERVKKSRKNDRMTDLILEKQEVEDKIRSIENFNRIFNAIWNKLDESEKILLSEFYIESSKSKQESLDVLFSKLCCEVATVYRLKSRALKKFKRLLAG